MNIRAATRPPPRIPPQGCKPISGTFSPAACSILCAIQWGCPEERALLSHERLLLSDCSRCRRSSKSLKAACDWCAAVKAATQMGHPPGSPCALRASAATMRMSSSTKLPHLLPPVLEYVLLHCNSGDDQRAVRDRHAKRCAWCSHYVPSCCEDKRAFVTEASAIRQHASHHLVFHSARLP